MLGSWTSMASPCVAVTYGQVPKNEPFRSCPSCANSLAEVSMGSDT